MAGDVVTIGPVVGLLGPEAPLREASQPREVAECYEHRNLRTGRSGILLAFANRKAGSFGPRRRRKQKRSKVHPAGRNAVYYGTQDYPNNGKSNGQENCK